MEQHYWTRSPGIGGRLESPEDFVVREIIHSKYLSRYEKSGKVRESSGRYGMFLLRKRNMTTHQALEIISRKFHAGKIGFAGLKDKFAVTEQYITVENGSDFEEKNICLKKICATSRFLSPGDLIGNRFEITLHRCRNAEGLGKILEEIKRRGAPNFFGPQRFGIHNNNHIIGKLIVKRQYGKALEMINGQYGRNCAGIREADKSRLKFFVNAYQSWLFNAMLDEYVKKGRYFGGELQLIGFNTKPAPDAAAIMKREKIRKEDFLISDARLKCSGGRRKAFIRPEIKHKTDGRTATLEFALPSGSYATVLLKEIMKGGLRA